MPRLINDHFVNKANEKLTIAAIDEPSASGVNHLYVIHGINTETNPSYRNGEVGFQPNESTAFLFQNGAIDEVGPNGLTNEALLAIVVDRLRCAQAGGDASPIAGLLLLKIEDALGYIKHRSILNQRVVFRNADASLSG